MTRTSFKTSDREIVEVVEYHLAARRAAHMRGLKFAAEHGAEDSAYLGGPTPFGGWSVFGIAVPEAPEAGKWKKVRGGFAPRAHTEEERVMTDARYDPSVDVPGIPFYSHEDSYLLSSLFFVLDGTAYASSGTGDSGEIVASATEAGWEEIITSEYEAAAESHRKLAEGMS